MYKRIIGAIGFTTLLVFATFTDLYILFYGFCFLFAIHETNIMLTNSKKGSIRGLLYLVFFSLGLISLAIITKENPGQAFYFTVIIMFTDTFAYIVGKKFGKHSFSKISPNKTIEGVIGGFVGGFIFSYIVLSILEELIKNDIWFLNSSAISNFRFTDEFMWAILVVFLLVIFSVLGDLFESYIKRYYGIKDSGFIVYGHGGILDRLDSWIGAAIFLVIYLHYFS